MNIRPRYIHGLLVLMVMINLVLGFMLLYVHERNRELTIALDVQHQLIQKAQRMHQRLSLSQGQLLSVRHLNRMADQQGFILPQGVHLVSLHES